MVDEHLKNAWHLGYVLNNGNLVKIKVIENGYHGVALYSRLFVVLRGFQKMRIYANKCSCLVLLRENSIM